MDVQESKQIQAMQETEKLIMIKQSVFPPTNIRISRSLKEELAWVIDKRLWVISNKMLFKTIVPLRN